ncbi:MAG: cell division protein ZapE [Gammaproteobacteria bacterium]|nr:cell division protein ZapE [Gammaproteobacteria bacterium]
MVVLDIYQIQVARCFDELRRQIDDKERKPSIFQWLKRLFDHSDRVTKIRGLYVWGGVGRGKTILMDEFFNQVQSEKKQRLHFHEFMQNIHQRLVDFKKTPDPLSRVTEQLAEDVNLLCLDEFSVTDIGDAMILDQLLRNLLKLEVILVITSNVPPADLYLNGLQRRRFWPAIRLIEEEYRVIRLRGKKDYRLETLRNEALYRIGSGVPPDMLARDCKLFVGRAMVNPSTLLVNNRSISTLFSGGGVVGLKFAELCRQPRSAADYVEIAKRFQTMLIYDVPQMTSSDEDSAKRFINLVDVLYDHSVNLILHARVDIAELYAGTINRSVFTRTTSRIQEMMSEEYIGQAHQL